MAKKDPKGKYHNFIVFDCETGGLDKKNQEHAKNYAVTQIALTGIDGKSLQKIDKYSTYIKGQWLDGEYVGYDKDLKYSSEALLFTKTTIEDLETKGKEIKEVRKQIKTFFNEVQKNNHSYNKPILVGHNVTYDIPFLQKLFWLDGESLEDYLHGYKDPDGIFHPVYIDTLIFSRIKYTDTGGKNDLSSACQREGIQIVDAHDADRDVDATISLFIKFLSMLKNGSSNESTDNNLIKRGPEKTARNSFSF